MQEALTAASQCIAQMTGRWQYPRICLLQDVSFLHKANLRLFSQMNQREELVDRLSKGKFKPPGMETCPRTFKRNRCNLCQDPRFCLPRCNFTAAMLQASATYSLLQCMEDQKCPYFGRLRSTFHGIGLQKPGLIRQQDLDFTFNKTRLMYWSMPGCKDQMRARP